MTERLYYTDAYLRTFDASILERADGGRRVTLDRTAFYPTSGGQPFDTGFLDEARVTDVVDEGDRITHVLDRPLETDRVRATVDWHRRFDHMQQHTGQHLLSAVIAELAGFNTTSVHFGAESSTLDLDAPALSPDQLVTVEDRANALVAENRPVTVGFEQSAGATGLRKASDRTGTLRIVTIADLDRSACGGTHVRATGEIGAILLRGVERVRKTTRLEFVCGLRAVRRARSDHELLSALAAPYSAAPADLPALLESHRAQLKDSAARLRLAEHELDLRRAGELYEAAAPDAAGRRLVRLLDEPGMTMERLRGLAQAITARPRVVFAGAITRPPGVLVAASEDSGQDAGHLLRQALERGGGRGGGNARLAQGTAPGEELAAVLAALEL